MKRLRVTPKRYFFLILVIAVIIFMITGCTVPAGDSSQTEGDTVGSGDQFDNEMELTLFYPNLSYDPENPESEMLIPVTRFVQNTGALARATVTELLRGPTFQEFHQHSVGPVVTGSVAINDIYIKNGICIIHLDYEGSIFTGLTMPDAEVEQLFVQSVVYSLESVPSISAVWLFYEDSPWQGDFWRYFGPVNVPNRSLEYTLYYRHIDVNNFDDYIWENVISSVTLVPDSQDPFGSTDNRVGPFFEIVENLTLSYDQDHGPVLPKDSIAVEFELHKGILIIHLAGRPPVGHQAAQVMVRSLIYTFTELPEIERVVVTIDGEPLSEGQFIWDTPMGRMDIE